VSRRLSFEIELRGQQVSVECFAMEPDRDVGIMGWYFEEETLSNSAGDVLDWDLSEDEQEAISEVVADIMTSGPDDL
jgi:hypothetical protein